ncbi:hypothetical protein T4B_1627 [Trichinella pseudospiralis]|uniref:Uncharacterized protein n=1 Tax=Trichinella pseudospiralis TaxID=6337 RepID=A0A0V1G993_TRIPS|nr:hypothetical protein T4B_1627 [Trichinella pseudospiralis]
MTFSIVFLFSINTTPHFVFSGIVPAGNNCPG